MTLGLKASVWVLLILYSVAASARAQGLRPSDEPPELPEFPDFPGEVEPGLLPPIPLPGESEEDRLFTGRGMTAKRIEVRGSSVFSDEELAVITAPFVGRELRAGELGELRNAITRLYVERGYVTSGALLPDQRVTDGVIVIEVIEGTLDEIQISGTNRLRPGYVESRIELGIETPVNVHDLEKRLQLLQQQDLIRRVDAELTPGLQRGSSSLSVLVEEGRALRVSGGVSNEQSPTVGSEGGHTRTTLLSPAGRGDVFSARVERTQGYDDLDFLYTLPLNAHETTLELNYRYTEGEVVENPFDDLDIESVARSVGVTLKHPLLFDLDQEFWLGLTGEYRTSETDWAFGDFPSTPGSDDGEVKISVFRFFQEWTSRSPERVVAARSTFNFGVDLFDATTNSGDRPDSRYFAWLGQFQMAQRLPDRYLRERFRGAQLVARLGIQLASEPLLSLEQFTLGGMYTVRGYRENQLVRDNGYDASLELRVPVLRNLLQGDVIELAPFFDIGGAWNDENNSGPKTLASLGMGVRYQLRDRIQARVYWGGRLRHVKRRGDRNIQDHGWHFNVEVALW